MHTLVALFPGSTICGWQPSKVINSPIAAPSGGRRGSTWVNKEKVFISQMYEPRSTIDFTTFEWSALLAHSSMPFEVIPFNARGFKLHSTTTDRFNRLSAEQNCTRPLTMTLGPDSSPKSTFSTKSDSASGCFDISTIFPVLISKTAKSDNNLFPTDSPLMELHNLYINFEK